MGQNFIDILRGLIREQRNKGDSKQYLLCLQTFLGDLQRINKDVVDRVEFLAEIKLQQKRIAESKSLAKENGVEYKGDALYERMLENLLAEFQPAQLTEQELYQFFDSLCVDAPRTKGYLMKALRANFSSDRYDGKLAAQIAGSFNPTDKVS